jgi:methionyl-tRNA formyltransferase
MRVEMLTHDDPIYTLPFFEEFFTHYGQELGTFRIYCCRAMGKRRRWQLLKELFFLYGPLGFVRLCTSWLRARLSGILPRTSSSKHFYSFAQLCSAFAIPYEYIGSPNDPVFVAGLKDRAPDLIISVACPYVLKPSVLSVPRLGCLNIHNAPLPRYKGMMPTFWQLYHGETAVGCTVHYMVPKIDEGPAVMQSSLKIEPGESLHHLMIRCKRHGAHCMAEVIRNIENGGCEPKALDESKGSYFTFPTIGEMREFHRRGLRAI